MANLATLIIAVSRALRNNGRVLMRTSNSFLRNQRHRAITEVQSTAMFDPRPPSDAP